MGLGGRYPSGQFLEWNYKNRTSFFPGHCNKVDGVTGETYHRPVDGDKILVFSPDACKYVPMEYVGDVEMFGIIGRKYAVGQSFLDNG